MIQFKRGGNPEEKIGLGKYRPFEVGDEVRATKNINSVGTAWYEDNYHPIIFKSNIYKILAIASGGDIIVLAIGTTEIWFERVSLKNYFERV